MAMNAPNFAANPELIAALTRTVVHQLLNAQQPEPAIDPELIGPPELPSSDSTRPQTDEDRLSAIEETIKLLLERTANGNDADDEGDGGSRRRTLGHILGMRYKDLTDMQKLARNELGRRIRQIMKALAKRAGDPDDEDEDEGDVLLPTDVGFAPNYEKPPKYSTNDSLISRTVEILLGQFEPSDENGLFTCEGVPFNKRDCYFLATTYFENKKRAYHIARVEEKKKKYERFKRINRRHQRQRHIKHEREAQAKTYDVKYGVKLPPEIFQSDFMTEPVSELDSSDISSPETTPPVVSGDEISATREQLVKTRRAEYSARLAAQVSLTAVERRRKVKVWEEKKPAARSKKLDRIFKRLDKLADKEREEENVKNVRTWARRVSLGNTKSAIPKCRKAVWPFMVDKDWLADDENFAKAAWTRLQQADPVGLDLQINTDSSASDDG